MTNLIQSLLVIIFLGSLSGFANCDFWSFKIITETTTIETTTSEPVYLPNNALACSVHENCTIKIFSLDAYCCQSIGSCCNWFLYTSYFQFKSNLPYKSPTILTYLVILIVVVSVLFVSYCFAIVFCYFFKCGLFRHPKIVVVSALPASNSISDSTSAEMISPKHSTTSSSSGSSTSSESSISIPHNRRRQTANSSRAKASSSGAYKSRSSSSGHGHHHHHSKSANSSRNGKSRYQNSKSQNYRNLRSPTARATSHGGGGGGGASSSRRSNHSHLNDSEIYIDYDNDSPFLIPPQLSRNLAKKSSRSNNLSSTRVAEERETVAHARSSYRSSSNAGATATASSTHQASLTVNADQQPSTSHAVGTAVAVVGQDHIAPIISPTPSGTSTINLEASLIETVDANELGLEINQVTTAGVRTSLVIPSAPHYYQDEKPPSYDDIIGRNY